MTVSSTTVSVSYTGNGSTTEFSFPNLFLADDHLVVTVDDVAQTLNSDYTVAGAKDPNGGAVTFTTAPASDTAVKIRRATELLQPLDLVANDRFPAEPAERAWDRLTLISQEQDGRLDEAEDRLDSGEGEADRALKYPSGGTHYQAEGRQIKQLAAPTADTDATTQAWVQQEILNAQLGGVDAGTAALADLGTDPDQVPTNAIRDERDSTFTGSNEFIQPLPVGEAVDPGHAVQLGQLTTQYGRTGAEDLPVTAQSRKLANYDGVNYLYTGSTGDTIKQITTDGTEVWTLEPSFSFFSVPALAVDADGFVYSGSEDDTVKKITPDGVEVWTFAGHTDDVQGVAVGEDGFVYSGSSDKSVKKITPDGTEVWTFAGYADTVEAVAADADGFVYLGTTTPDVQKINPDGTEVWTFAGHSGAVRAVAVDAAGFVYSGSIDDTIKKLSPEGVEVWTFAGHTDNINSVAVDAAGFVYSGSMDGTIRKISPEGVEVWSFSGHTGDIEAVAVDASGFVYSGSQDTTVRKINADGVEVWSFTGHTSSVYAVAVDAAGFVYSGSSDDTLRKISPEGMEVWSFDGHTDAVRYVAVGDDGFVYSGSDDDTIKKITPDGVEVWTFAGHNGFVRDVAVDAAGFVYSASRRNHVRKISPEGEEVWLVTGHTDPVMDVAVDTNGFVYSGALDWTTRKINPNGTEVWLFDGHTDEVRAVAVDADGFVYSGSRDRTLRKLTPDGVEVWSLAGHPSSVDSIAVDAAGFVYSGSSQTVRKITPDGVEVWTFTGHTNIVRAVAVDAVGFVYSASSDNTVKKLSPDGVEVWSLDYASSVQSVAVDPGLVGAGFWSVDFPITPRIRGVRIVTEDTNLTPSEIKTAYESNPDTNAYTDSEKSKLDGIESGATADQTASEIKTAYESNADTNAYTDAEKTKVGHIAVSAATDLDSIRTRVDELDAAVVLVGEWDASLGTFPGGGTAGAGESWIVNADGTVDGIEFRVGDRIIALVDGASTTIYAGNWIKADYTDRVSTVHGRTGAVVGQSGDYSASQVTNDSGVSGADVAAALDTLDAAKANSADLGALASQDTVGTADIDNAAATNAKLANMAANTIKARLAGSGAPQDVAIAANRLLARASTGDLEAKELTDFALSLLDDADAATMRTTLGLGSMSTQSASAVAITGGSIAGTNLNTQTADLETMIAQGL